MRVFVLLCIFIVLLPDFCFSLTKIHREEIEWSNIWLSGVGKIDKPHILMIGNSITKSYASIVSDCFSNSAYISYLTTSKSLGDPLFIKEVEMVLSQIDFDVIHFNNGLHGKGYSEVEFIDGFKSLLMTIDNKAPDAYLIWATITPVRKSGDLFVFDEFNHRVMERNSMVLQLINDKDILVNDLYGILKDRPNLYLNDGIHLNPDGCKIIASEVVAYLRKCLFNKD